MLMTEWDVFDFSMLAPIEASILSDEEKKKMKTKKERKRN
jgi:hypothetical protein